jgi:ABC-type lipoprotein release transport system permease subunit
MEDLLSDIRYCCRALANRPGIALVVVLTLAVGIGSTTAICSALNAVLFRPLPYPAPDRLVMIWGRFTRFDVRATDPGTFALVAAGLVGVALVARYLPARRAARLGPARALRQP